MIAPASRSSQRASTDPDLREDARGVPNDPLTPANGRSLVTRRAVTDIVRAATLGSYGVIGFAGAGVVDRIAEAVGLPPRGIRIQLRGELTIDLDLTIGHGVPVAEVARQVDSAVRYAVRRALDREVGRLTIHVAGLASGPFETTGRPDAAAGQHGAAIAPDDLAGSGTDVA
jgi:uncharacterized alkaline shock family protein YloU